MLNQWGQIERFPESILGPRQELALLFKEIATLRIDATLFENVDELEWNGPGPDFAAVAKKLDDARLLNRANGLAEKLRR